MRLPTLVLVAGLLAGCEKDSGVTDQMESRREGVASEKPLIRSLWFAGIKPGYGVGVNGTRAFFNESDEIRKQSEISLEVASGLIDEFYRIPDIEKYRGKKSDNRQSSIHHLVVIYDEMEGRYSEELLDYVIPKDQVEAESPLGRWLEKMRSLREKFAGQDR